ncbi:flagellar protein FlgN [Halanaerobium sp. MA284_MarDTE_T2]|uniref:flagellar protein FlgN n=1 Tax=Halanaerobium sp. MA284_MarDTE_T2 TaxID=2183913 RepID=UPI000DF29455|nr:flagellar protein FlgN [Halanaerobium sp. MA284_MarDTE_T2]RCW48212.1 FlgN protein [Halanaerobium sp. MA284_MarDTE_T2]
MNQKLKDSLLNILNEEKELYLKLLKIAEEKNETLVENNTEKLMQTVEKDKDIINKIETAEEKRNEIVSEIIEQFNIDNENKSYSELIKNLPEDWGKDLDPLRDELIEITDEFQKINLENHSLLKQALEFNQLSIDTILNSIQDEDITYSKDKIKQPKLLDKQG